MAPKQRPAVRASSGHPDMAFNPELRIPPLQHPLPLLPSRRPPLLEPNARVYASALHPTAKLSSRSKALEEARPIGEDEEQGSYAAPSRHGTTAAGTSEAVRKRKKVDIFQLPKPTSQAIADQPPLFEPVPVLNELHEPPPSSGLFPPITPNTLPGIKQNVGRNEQQVLPIKPKSGKAPRSPPSESLAADTKAIKPKAKRKCLRGRLKWTDSETQDLLKGVGIYGVGKWKKILTHPGFSFHPDRTMVDLKDRYRTCRMNEEKAIERQAAEENSQSKESASARSGATGSASSPKGHSRQPSASSPIEPEFSITTLTNFEERRRQRSPKRRSGGANPWTSDDDANLSRGYQKYGFQWTAIAKDPDFNLGHRTGAQVRDRFRMKYPIVYQSSVPLPLPDAAKRAPRNRRRDEASGDAAAKNPSQLTFIMHDADKPVHGEKRPRPRALPAIQPPQTVPSLSSQGSSPGTPAVMLPDRFSGLNVQPLPDPDQEGVSDDDDDDDNDVEEEGSNADDPEEVRHLSILGLLNDDVEQDERLPPFKYALDDWDPAAGVHAGVGVGVSVAGAGSVTLPPLLSWDDMAMGNKPMFDLE